MRSLLAILAAKTAFKINRLSGSGGTSLPGLVAQKLDHDILQKLAHNNFPKGVIVVTGTNGKTTTTKLIADILKKNGITYIHNKTGSNMERGLISSIIQESSFDGKSSAQMGLFEVDEANMPKVCMALKPDWIVVTNLFRDQLDRYGELDKIAKMLRNLFDDLPDAQIILNSDDPLVASLGFELESNHKVVYFGVDDYVAPKLAHDHTADSIFDPFTQERLYYTQQYFGHMGKYRSKNGGFSRPKPNYSATNIKQSGIESIQFSINSSAKLIKLDIPGLFNVYNYLSAYALAGTALGLSSEDIISSIGSSPVAFGRSEELQYHGRAILMLLIKNPTGLNQIIQTYLLHKKDRLLVFVINDNYADGRDVSWLWDGALEDLQGYKGKIIVAGSRANDMALRLKYADLEDITIVEDSHKLLDAIEQNSSARSKVFVLPTYTAMLNLRSQIVARDNKAKEFWQ